MAGDRYSTALVDVGVVSVAMVVESAGSTRATITNFFAFSSLRTSPEIVIIYSVSIFIIICEDGGAHSADLF